MADVDRSTTDCLGFLLTFRHLDEQTLSLSIEFDLARRRRRRLALSGEPVLDEAGDVKDDLGAEELSCPGEDELGKCVELGRRDVLG